MAEASPAERMAAKGGISEPNSGYMHAIMPYHMFVVPIHDDGLAIAELNGFLRSHKVLSVDRRWVNLGTESFWSFCVDYLERGAGGAHAGKGGPARGKVDYREVLSPEDFAVFARLRQMRKEIARGRGGAGLRRLYQRAACTNGADPSHDQGRRWRGSPRSAMPGSRSTGLGSSSCWANNGPGPQPMRRAGNLFEQVVDRENLRLAVSKALRGKRCRSDARQFVAKLDEQLDWMRSALVRGDFPLGVYHQFTIFDPKERLITAPCFRERVLAPRDRQRL